MLDNTNIWLYNPILFNSLKNDNYDKFVENLFNYSSLINNSNPQGETLLHYCSFYGMIDKYYALINMGADVKETREHNNLLHYASFSGNDDFLIVELIKSGINPTAKNTHGHTSIHYSKNERICHYLNLWCLRNNIKIENLKDHSGNTVAHLSYALQHTLSTQYWLRNHPVLSSIPNKDGQLYHQMPELEFNFANT